VFPRWSLLPAVALLVGGTAYALRAFATTRGEGFVLLATPAALALVALAAFRARGPGLPLAAHVVLFPAFILGASLALPASAKETKSTRHLADAAASAAEAYGLGIGTNVFFYGSVPPSAEFYFRGRGVPLEESLAELRGAAGRAGALVVFRKGREAGAASADEVTLTPVESGGDYRYRIYLVRANADPVD
jgi:hypothetical protein